MADGLGPAVVPGNRWTDLDPPSIEDWTPSRSVGVVVPYFEATDELARTLAGLAAQSYPAELYRVVVVDDGSDPPLTLSDPPPELTVEVIHQEDRGFGLARARNTGAKALDAEILVFLDADMVPERDWLAAHARWHHVVSDALVVGFRRHVEFGARSPAEISEAVSLDRMEGVFASETVEEPAWIDFHMARTAELAGGHHDAFRAVTGGNLSIRAELFTEVGRFDESFIRWGAEDTEFAYRAYVSGAIMIPERAALAWHQGRGATPDDDEQDSLQIQRAKIASLIAHSSFRPDHPPRSYLVPRIAVTVVGKASRSAYVATIDSVLASDVADVTVLALAEEADVADVVTERYRGEPRVTVGPGGTHPYAWARLHLPAGAQLRGEALSRLLDNLEEVGIVKTDLPDGGQAVGTLTRANRRAFRVTGSASDWPTEAERLFGARYVAWQDAGFAAGSGWQPSPGFKGRLEDPGSRTGKTVRYLAGSRSFGDAFRIFRWMGRRARRRLGG